ncbi:MAG: hypothetical protein QM726_06365 [Chitinophagaceae bacterium]
MKSLSLYSSIICLLFTLAAHSQSEPPINQRPTEKPSLFNLLPEKISCSETALRNIFSMQLNNTVSVELSQFLKIEGAVIAKVAVSADQLSINIRCSNYKNALLNISRITEADGHYTYIGRMVNPQQGDVLLLWQENGQYSLIKQKQLLTMVE